MYQAGRIYEDFIGRKINWDNPQEYSEKGRWLQFNSDTSRWAELADKYRVRKYIEEKDLARTCLSSMEFGMMQRRSTSLCCQSRSC